MPKEDRGRRWGALLARAAVIALLALSSACATIDFDAPKPESYAFTDTADTLLGRRGGEFDLGAPGTSGFKMIIDGVDARGSSSSYGAIYITDNATVASDAMVITVSGDPFRVTYPNGGETLTGGVFFPTGGYISDPQLATHNLRRAAAARRRRASGCSRSPPSAPTARPRRPMRG